MILKVKRLDPNKNGSTEKPEANSLEALKEEAPEEIIEEGAEVHSFGEKEAIIGVRAVFSEPGIKFKKAEDKTNKVATSKASSQKTLESSSAPKLNRILILMKDFRIHQVDCSYKEDEQEYKTKFTTLDKITPPEEWLHDKENPEELETLAHNYLQRVFYFD